MLWYSVGKYGQARNGSMPNVWWMQDGAPAHRATIVRDRLQQLFPRKVVGLWFCFSWGYLKDQVCILFLHQLMTYNAELKEKYEAWEAQGWLGGLYVQWLNTLWNVSKSVDSRLNKRDQDQIYMMSWLLFVMSCLSKCYVLWYCDIVYNETTQMSAINIACYGTFFSLFEFKTDPFAWCFTSRQP